MEPKFSPPSKGGISGLKVIFFFPLLPLGAIVGGVVDFFLCKRGGEAGKEGISANEKKAWRRIWCGFFFQCGCNGHGAFSAEECVLRMYSCPGTGLLSDIRRTADWLSQKIQTSMIFSSLVMLVAISVP